MRRRDAVRCDRLLMIRLHLMMFRTGDEQARECLIALMERPPCNRRSMLLQFCGVPAAGSWPALRRAIIPRRAFHPVIDHIKLRVCPRNCTSRPEPYPGWYANKYFPRQPLLRSRKSLWKKSQPYPVTSSTDRKTLLLCKC